ncbi:MAG TPA: ABC transporter permease [Nitrospiraceae bacterium]|jgi:ABC-type transport system involved in multi-copper enzyme maturation permease subunit|nr:ABC transporter permease [Nitrospiraceae bacterium]
MTSILVIALNSFRETLRDKILYNLLIFAVLLIGASVLLGELTIAEHKKVVTDMGLAAINLIGILIAVFVGIGLVSKEIERRTVYTIMARPISRTQFLLGKYAGLVLTLSVNVLIMMAVFSVTLLLSGALVHIALFQAVALIFVELLVVTAVALLFSTFSSATLSAILTLAIYVIGHLTADLRGIAAKTESVVLKWLTEGLYYVFPNLEMLNVKGQGAWGISIPLSYQVVASTYGILYAALLLMVACVVFQRRDF